MAIFRVHKNKNYTTMSNFHLQDNNLSLKAKGLLSLMLSLPENWDYSVRGLEKICIETKDTINGILNELEKNNYLIRRRIYCNGKISHWEYDIYESNLHPKNQDIEKQDIENYDINKELNNKVLNNKNNNDDDNKENLIDFLQNNGFVLNDILFDVVKEWEDNELTRYAIKKAVLNNKYNINYIQKILYSYEKNNIKSVQEAIEQDEEFNNKKDFYYKNKYQVKESRYEREQRLLREMCEDEQN